MIHVIPVDDVDGVTQRRLAEIPVFSVIERPQQMQHFRYVDVRVVVDVAEPPFTRVFEESVKLGRHLAAEGFVVVRGAAVGVDEPVGRKSLSQFRILGVREEVSVFADERNPRVQEYRKTRLVELRRRFHREENVF